MNSIKITELTTIIIEVSPEECFITASGKQFFQDSEANPWQPYLMPLLANGLPEVEHMSSKISNS